MDDAQRLRVKRRSCKASITKLLAKVEEAMTHDLSTVNSEVVTESRRLTTATTLTQLKAKKDTISKMNEDISETIKEEEELETELTDADTYVCELEEKLAIVEEFVKKASKPTHSVTDDKDIVSDDKGTASDDDANLPINTPICVNNTQHTFSRLPKLMLPTFNGNQLYWQTFWDSFKAAVDSNQCLSPVQKFSYLRSQLQGDAARAISGLPLTDDNYTESVRILRERFGQQYKLVDAHMEALLNVTAPSNNLVSLQSFHDPYESTLHSWKVFRFLWNSSDFGHSWETPT